MKRIAINIPERYNGLIAGHDIDTKAMVRDIVEMKIWHNTKMPQFRKAQVKRTIDIIGDYVELTDDQVAFLQADMANIQEWVDNAIDATLRRQTGALKQI